MSRIVAILLFALGIFAYCIEITGKSVKVYDGDTILIETIKGERYKIRLAGIDAPETKQKFGKEAGDFLYNAIFAKYVLADVSSIDMYGRMIGTVFIRENNETIDVNALMIQKGFAWFYGEYSNSDKLRELEKNAKCLKLGLWKDDMPIKPSDFRKSMKK